MQCTLIVHRYYFFKAYIVIQSRPRLIAICAVSHRQWCDWTMYLASAGIAPLAGRRCALTHCRMLKSRPPVLLPTPIGRSYAVFRPVIALSSSICLPCTLFPINLNRTAMFLLRMGDQLEAYLVQDIFQPLYAGFWAQHVCPCAANGGSGTTLQARLNATLSPAAATNLPDNAEVKYYLRNNISVSSLFRHARLAVFEQTLALFAEVLGYSELKDYESSSTSAQYRLVALRLETPSAAARQGPVEQRAVVAYMILFDEQVPVRVLFGHVARLSANCFTASRLTGGPVRTVERGGPFADIPTISARQCRGNLHIWGQPAQVGQQSRPHLAVPSALRG